MRPRGENRVDDRRWFRCLWRGTRSWITTPSSAPPTLTTQVRKTDAFWAIRQTAIDKFAINLSLLIDPYILKLYLKLSIFIQKPMTEEYLLCSTFIIKLFAYSAWMSHLSLSIQLPQLFSWKRKFANQHLSTPICHYSFLTKNRPYHPTNPNNCPSVSLLLMGYDFHEKIPHNVDRSNK